MVALNDVLRRYRKRINVGPNTPVTRHSNRRNVRRKLLLLLRFMHIHHYTTFPEILQAARVQRVLIDMHMSAA